METPNNVPKLPTVSSLNSKITLVVVFLIGAIVGALVMFGIQTNKIKLWNVKDNTITKEQGTSNTIEENATDTVIDAGISTKVKPEPVAVSGSNAIAANDQKAGNTVEITMVTFSVPGWVAIHEDKDGTLGNVLGAGRFEQGIHLGEIELLRGTVSGGTYHAVLYQDNGDRRFDMVTDAPIKNADGKIIEATFKAE